MNKFIKKNWIVLLGVLIALMAIGILSITGKPSIKYKLSSQEVLNALNDKTHLVSPGDLAKLTGNTAAPVVIVDIRNTDAFAKGHIDKAVNIPVLDLFNKKSLQFFKELASLKEPVVLYGDDQLQADGPWMLLRQVGFDNVKVLQGGYGFYSAVPANDSIMKQKLLFIDAEKSLLDTAEFHQGQVLPSKTENSVTSEKPRKVVPAKKTQSSGGGC